MAEASVGSSEDHQGRVSPADPTSATTAVLQREISHLSARIDLKIEGLEKATQARLDAIDLATRTFQENLTRVPTAVDKAVGDLRSLAEIRFNCIEKEARLSDNVIVTRFDGMDRALKLLQDIADRFPERIDEKISSLKEIHEGQFDAVQVQFRERDVRTAETSKQSEVAISAALQAAKEAVGKSEVVTSKQIEDLKTLFNTTSGAQRDRLDELNERVTRNEGTVMGQAGQKVEQGTSTSMVISIISIGITILLALFAAFTFIQRIPGR